MTDLPATKPGAQQRSGEATIIPACDRGVTSLCAHSFLAILAALSLRLFFALRYSGSSDDSSLYIQFARNWADYHIYGIWLDGHLIPTDLRTPGYPAFLAGVALLFGRSLRAIVLSQAALDVLTCFLTAGLSAALAPAGTRRRVWIVTWWVAATCPFLANYSAVILTETLVTFLATAALWCFALGLRRVSDRLRLRDERHCATPFAYALLGAFLTGLATLVRPEMPLLGSVAAIVYMLRGWRVLGARKTLLFAAAMAAVFLIPLLPWALRNLVTLKKVQFVAPRYVNLPGESTPVGFYAWTGTWLERYRDVYFTIWKIGEEDQPLNVDDLPSSAFDSPEEKARVADLFSAYNMNPNLDISTEADDKFPEIARERTQRHPFRTYLRVPFERALTIWFTPRTELLPIDGKFFPVRKQWADSHVDVLVTGSFAVLGYLYVALAAGGIWLAWHGNRGSAWGGRLQDANLWGISLVLIYFIIRTAFLTTVEAPEPRYVVSCYPGILAFIGLLGIRKGESAEGIK